MSSILLYPEAVMVMKGDYVMSKWSGIIETNKNWLLLGALGSIGGSVIYLVAKGISKARGR